MPDLGGHPKFKVDDEGSEQRRKPNGSKPAPASNRSSQQRPARNTRPAHVDDEDEYDEDEDELDEDDEVISNAMNRGGKKNNMVFIGLAAVVVVVIVLVFVLLRGGNKEPAPNPDAGTNPPQQTTEETPPSDSSTEPYTPGNVGIQDFTQDTNNVSDSPLTNPEHFIQDLQGLTTRVNYEVTAINNIVDYVNYTKYRGTWGGGLELYYLDCLYHGNRYVIQVPFKYYKELEDSGIVPVMMELLHIKDGNDDLTVVSYMTLDEDVLNAILNAQEGNNKKK